MTHKLTSKYAEKSLSFNILLLSMTEPLQDIELEKLVEELRKRRVGGNIPERSPDTLAMAEVELTYTLQRSSMRLEKSSNRLEKLTIWLNILTVILIIFTIVLILKGG